MFPARAPLLPVLVPLLPVFVCPQGYCCWLSTVSAGVVLLRRKTEAVRGGMSAKSEWLPVTCLGARAGISGTAASQHVAVLLRLKMVERGVGRLYRLVPALRPAAGEEWLDFGYLRLRLGPPSQPAA